MKYTAYFTISGFFTFDADNQDDAQKKSEEIKGTIYTSPDLLESCKVNITVNSITEGE